MLFAHLFIIMNSAYIFTKYIHSLCRRNLRPISTQKIIGKTESAPDSGQNLEAKNFNVQFVKVN